MTGKERTQGFDISAFSACVIGCGGLGNNAATHLAGAGIGRLVLCDYDTVERSNLNRQFMYTGADIGKPKVRLLKERLSAYAPDCLIEAVEKKITSPDDLSFALGCDIMLACLDNTETRGVLDKFCTDAGIPLINGGITGFYGTCYFYVPGKTPSLEQAGLLAPPKEKPKSVSSTAGIIGALMAEIAGRYFLNDSPPAGRLLVYDGCSLSGLTLKGGFYDET